MGRERDGKLPPQPDLDALRQEFEEFQAPFEHDASKSVPEPAETSDLEAFRLVHQAVARNYGHVCAMTGAPDLGIADVKPGHRVSVIQRRGAGGSLHTTNFIWLSNAAADAFAAGQIAIGASHQLLVDLSRIDPELLEALNPNGLLRMPKTDAPDADALGWHRRIIFGKN